MSKREARKLKHGVYRIFYKGHGSSYSLASVGSDESGDKWFAPANWIDKKKGHILTLPSYHWSLVTRVELIEAKK